MLDIFSEEILRDIDANLTFWDVKLSDGVFGSDYWTQGEAATT